MPKFLRQSSAFCGPTARCSARIDAAAAAGFRAVEMHWPYDMPAEDVRDACARQGLTLLALNTPTGEAGEFGLGAVPGRVEAFREGFRQAAAYARDAGAGAIHVMAGKTAGGDRAEAETVFADNLVWASAEAPDLTLLLEPINRVDQPDYFYSTIPEAAALLFRLGLPTAGILFDAYHVAMGGADPLAAFEAYLPRIRHVQIAAVPSRAEPDEGEIDYSDFFKTVDRRGYRGWVGCEYKPRAGTDTGLAWCDALHVTLGGEPASGAAR